jgi:hypothetical protein
MEAMVKKIETSAIDVSFGCAPSWICSEPPSLKSGEKVHKRIIFSGI